MASAYGKHNSADTEDILHSRKHSCHGIETYPISNDYPLKSDVNGSNYHQVVESLLWSSFIGTMFGLLMTYSKSCIKLSKTAPLVGKILAVIRERVSCSCDGVDQSGILTDI